MSQFEKLTMNADELNMIYHYGKEVHNTYFFFKVHIENLRSELLLVHKTPNGKAATVQDLTNTLKCRYAEKYQYVGYSKGSAKFDTQYIIDADQNLPLFSFAFLNFPHVSTNTNPGVVASNTAVGLSDLEPEMEPRIYKLKMDTSRPMGPIVLEPARPAGESIGPLDPVR
jgi:hypothetical protein